MHAWVGSVPKHTPENDGQKIETKTAKETVLSSTYAAADIGVDESDPTGLKKGDAVTVTPNDE